MSHMEIGSTVIRTKASIHVAHRLADTVCIFLGLSIASQLGQTLDRQQLWTVGLVATVFFWMSSELTANYRRWLGASLIGEAACAWMTWGLTTTALIVLGAVLQYGSGLTRLSFLIWSVTTCLLLIMVRSSIRTVESVIRAKGIGTRGYAIVGVTPIGIQLATNIEASPELGLQLAGFYDDRPRDRTVELPDSFGPSKGNVSELLELTQSGQVQVIYITFPMRAENRIREVLNQLADTTASVYVVPDFFVFELLHARWNNIMGIPVVSIFENPFYGIDGLLKRLFDVVLSLILLVVCAIPMLIVAILVKTTSPGPVLFKQARYGLDGKEIPVWKFRSMTVCEDGAKVTQATKHDARVTTVGRIIRKTSLDELPQLFNVLQGHMSLVGPRPHATAHNEEYRRKIQGYMLRHKVRPGITGLAQVEGWRGETDTLVKMEKRIEFDHKYIRDWNIWLDFQILLRTISVVFGGKNAY